MLLLRAEENIKIVVLVVVGEEEPFKKATTTTTTFFSRVAGHSSGAAISKGSGALKHTKVSVREEESFPHFFSNMEIGTVNSRDTYSKGQPYYLIN